MNDNPTNDPERFASASAEDLIGLLVANEDRVPHTLFQACVARGDRMVAALADYFRRFDGWDNEDGKYDWWMEIHGFWLAGAIPGEAAGRLLIDMLRRADDHDDHTLDWVAGYMPWLFANKPAVIAELARGLAEDREVGWFARCEAVDAVIGMAHAEGPDALETALDWLAALAAEPEVDKELRRLGANALLDFPRPRHRALLNSLAMEQESDSRLYVVFDSDDVARAFSGRGDEPDWTRRGPPWGFYDDDQIMARQKRWREDDERAIERKRQAAIDSLYPETYLRDTPKLGRNDPCHCGSGKKYKKCCLPADEARSAIQLNPH